MKRVLVILLVFALLVPNVCYAKDTFETDISLCYDGDAFSVDYEFEVIGDATITDVTLNDKNCYFEWNHVASEARLYLSLASGDVIARADKIATVVSDAEFVLISVSIKVNGKTKKDAYAYHETVITEGLDPTIDSPGYTSSEKCEKCNLMIAESEVIPALGPSVSAALDDDGILSVTGELSDRSTSKGITLVAVYDDSNKMIALKDATDLDQTGFSMEIENIEDADTVKVFRFEMSDLVPLYKAAEADVVKK